MGVSKADETSKTTKVSAIDLIREAIKTTGLPRKGASFVNIRKFVLEFDENADPKRQVRSLKLALKKGLDSGILIRPNHCKNSVGATGSFLLGKKLPAKTVKESAKKSLDPDVEPEVPQKKSKDAKKPTKSTEKKTKDTEKKQKVPAKTKASQKTAKAPEKASKTLKNKSKDTDNISEDLAKISKASKSKNQVKNAKTLEKTKAEKTKAEKTKAPEKTAEKKSKAVEKKPKAVSKESKVMEKKPKDPQEKKPKVEVTKATEKNKAKGKNTKASKNSHAVDESTSNKVTPKTSDKVKVVMKAKRTNNMSKQESDIPDTPKISAPMSKGNHSIRLLSATGSKRPAIAYTFRPSMVVESGKKILKKYAKMRVQKGLLGTDGDETRIQKPEKAVSDKTTKADNPKAAVKLGKNVKSKKAVPAESSSQGMKKAVDSKNKAKKLYSTPVTSKNRLGVFDPEHDASLIGPQQTKLVFSESESSDTEEPIEETKESKVKKNIPETESTDSDEHIEERKESKVKKNIPETESSDSDGSIEENEGPKVKKNRSSIETGYASLDTEIVAKKNKRPKVSASDTELTFIKSDTVSTKQKKTGKVQVQKKATKKTSKK